MKVYNLTELLQQRYRSAMVKLIFIIIMFLKRKILSDPQLVRIPSIFIAFIGHLLRTGAITHISSFITSVGIPLFFTLLSSLTHKLEKF